MARLSSASIRLVQKMNRQNSSGEFPIYIVICWKGRVEKSTGVSCLPRYWDAKRELIKNSAPNSAILNKTLSDIKQKAINRRNEFEYIGKRYTASMLLEDSIQDLSANDNEFKVIYKHYLSEMASSDNTIKLYDYNFNVLKKYFGKEDFLITDISLANIKKLIKSLDLGDNSIRGICGRIASIWNYAIRKGLVDSSDYPFKDFVYSQKFKKDNRTYYLEKCNLIKLRDYFISHCLDVSGELYSYRDGIEDKLMKRSSKEFALMFFLMLFISNGSSPIDIALLKVDNCNRVTIDGIDYWRIEFKRKKTGRGVKCLLERNILTMVCFEHYLGRCGGGYIYPVLKEGMSNKQISNAVAKFTGYASKNLKLICNEINEATIKSNVENCLQEPLIETEHMTLYVARHTFANIYLSRPNSSVHGLASLMARSPNTIATYIHNLRGDKEIADATKGLLI